MTEVKRGTLKFYHRGLLNKKWKYYYFILYDSSLLTWYSDIKHRKPDGMVLLKDVERFICVGPYTRCLPDYPHLENEYDEVALIAFPLSVKNRDRDLVWLLCQEMEELNSWMKAIVQTLPSHTLHMENTVKVSSSPANETISAESSPIETSETITLSTSSIRLPLAAGLLGSRLQGSAMNNKVDPVNPLQKVGYDYGDTLWGTGEGWGYFSPLTVPGYAGVGGSGCYANHLDLIRTEEDEGALKNVEDNLDPAAHDEEAVDRATNELSKNRIEDDEHHREGSPHEHESTDEELEEYEIEEELKMIDSDGSK